MSSGQEYFLYYELLKKRGLYYRNNIDLMYLNPKSKKFGFWNDCLPGLSHFAQRATKDKDSPRSAQAGVQAALNPSPSISLPIRRDGDPINPLPGGQ